MAAETLVCKHKESFRILLIGSESLRRKCLFFSLISRNHGHALHGTWYAGYAVPILAWTTFGNFHRQSGRHANRFTIAEMSGETLHVSIYGWQSRLIHRTMLVLHKSNHFSVAIDKFRWISVHVWKPQRKLLNPTFNNKILQSFIPIFNEKSQIFVDVLAQKVGNQAFDISKQVFACTLEMICCESIKISGWETELFKIDFPILLSQQQQSVAIWNSKVTKMWKCWKWWKRKSKDKS